MLARGKTVYEPPRYMTVNTVSCTVRMTRGFSPYAGGPDAPTCAMLLLLFRALAPLHLLPQISFPLLVFAHKRRLLSSYWRWRHGGRRVLMTRTLCVLAWQGFR